MEQKWQEDNKTSLTAVDLIRLKRKAKRMMAEINNAYEVLLTSKTAEEEHIERFYYDFI